MATHRNRVVDEFKARQAAALTANLTPEHHPGMVTQLGSFANAIRAMQNQLFLQAFLTIELMVEIIEEGTLYFAQRIPKEIGELAWIIDRKDRTITQMEELWSTLILQFSESHFGRHKFKTLRGADHSHFDAHCGVTTETVDGDMSRHLKWAACCTNRR